MGKDGQPDTTQVTQTPTILYIEDNLDNQKLVMRVLQAAGYKVHGASDGPSGFAYLQTHTPDLILMDIHLPGMDGFTMTRQLRQNEQFAYTPIITLTANVTQEDQQRSREVGSNGFIQKPINVDSLPDQIQAFLASSKRETP